MSDTYPVSLARYGRLRMTSLWRTVVTEYEGGQEQRDARWLTPRFRFDISYDLLEDAPRPEKMFVWQVLFDHYMDRKGRFASFHFQDWTRADRLKEILGKGNGVRTVFKIYEDKASAITVYKNNVVQSTGFTLDLTTGKITFTAAPASGDLITADVTQGLFKVRFDMDDAAWERLLHGDWRAQVSMLQVRENV